jgi:bacteriorhodopsin
MFVIHQRSNGALDTNPPIGTHHLTLAGSDWLWAVCALYAFAMLFVVAHAYIARNDERIFHYLFTISLFTGAIAYYTVASDLGNVTVQVADTLSSSGTRQIFYAKYINWFVGWTPLVIAIGIVSGVSWATIVYNVALTWVWTATWLAGVFVSTNYKWGYFALGLFASFLLSYSLLHHGLKSSRPIGIKNQYCMIAGYLVFLWLLYPIAYGLSDGGNKISVTSGFIFFGVLDVLTVPVLAAAFLFLPNRWDYGRMDLRFTQYGRVATSGPVFLEHEKILGPRTPTVSDGSATAPAETV